MAKRRSHNNASIEQVLPSNGDGRKLALTNLVPLNLDDEIRCAAYLMSERRGFEPGHETEDWLTAEREVLGRYHQQRA